MKKASEAKPNGAGSRRRAVFLDRDGTLVEDRGHLSDPSQAVFFPDTVPALRLLQERFALFIVTHQQGISEGILDAAEVDRVNQGVEEHLARHGVRILKTYCCSHTRAEGCECIKPKVHFLRQAEREFTIDLAGSFSVGDHPHDAELARNAGGTGIYVLTGHGERHRREIAPDVPVAAGIREAAQIMADAAVRGALDGAGGS